jgi:hypothetical protein
MTIMALPPLVGQPRYPNHIVRLIFLMLDAMVKAVDVIMIVGAVLRMHQGAKGEEKVRERRDET